MHITFTGKSSHAAAFPWDGINALDAAVMCYQSISVLRQQMKPTWRVHGKAGTEQLLEQFLRLVRTLCVARNSPVHSNGVINYAIAVSLFQTVLRDRLKSFPGTIESIFE